MKKFNRYQIFALIWASIHVVCASGCFYGFLANTLGAAFTLLYIILTTICFVSVYESLEIREKNNSYNEKEE